MKTQTDLMIPLKTTDYSTLYSSDFGRFAALLQIIEYSSMYISIRAGIAGNIRVVDGVKPDCIKEYSIFNSVLQRDANKEIEANIKLEANISAPVICSDVVGTVEYMKDGEKIGKV